MEGKPICFKVVFKPIVGWVDQAYLGNMLIEVLGVVSRKTAAFEFEIETMPEGEKS